MNNVLNFLLIVVLLIVIDFIWIGIINSQNYKKVIKAVQKSDLKVRMLPGLVVYIALAFIILYWVVPSVKVSTNQQSLFMNAFTNGFLLGALVYAVFDFTNMAIFNDWTLTISIIDSLWGGVLSGLITYIIVKVNNH
jgi:uncharacterized membrane protein